MKRVETATHGPLAAGSPRRDVTLLYTLSLPGGELVSSGNDDKIIQDAVDEEVVRASSELVPGQGERQNLQQTSVADHSSGSRPPPTVAYTEIGGRDREYPRSQSSVGKTTQEIESQTKGRHDKRGSLRLWGGGGGGGKHTLCWGSR